MTIDTKISATTDLDDQATLRVAIVGHVDHGKSTVVGRLLHETGCLPEGKVEQVAATCKQRGMPFEWAFVTDALQAERNQGVTIDVSYIRLTTPERQFLLVDAPGHREFLKNMISGTAGSDAALLVIDAAEGVRQQSRRHGYLLHLLGITQVVVAVNKMDLADYSEARFADIEKEYRAYLASLGITPLAVVPVSAREGHAITGPSDAMPWYRGPSVLDALGRFSVPPAPKDLPLRMPVQDVYKFDQRRLIVGRIETGQVSVGDTILFSPSNKTAHVESIESWNAEPPHTATAGDSVALTLDEQIFVERGEIISHETDPPQESPVFRARLFWLSSSPMTEGANYTLKLGPRSATVRVQEIERVIDTDTLDSDPAETADRDAIAEVVLRARAMLALDPISDNPRTGRFVLVDGYDLVAGGVINMEGYPDRRALVTVKSSNVQEVEHRITGEMRAAQNGHHGGVLWFTGLSGAGKSTLAVELERQLFRKGYHVYVLDGDNVRRGLNANLGFSPEDRAENIRRVGEVAGLFAEAGMIVISAFISPYRADRETARTAAGDDFHEVFIDAGLDVCEARDPKGLYKRARTGEIPDFTGITAPYEAPEKPQLVVDTGGQSVDDSVARIVEYVENNFEFAKKAERTD